MTAPLDPSAASARRLGVLGGSFDPPHAGHLHVARAALGAFELDHVVFVPAARPPHKPAGLVAAGQTRLEMVRLLIQGQADLSVWAGELERPGPSYTVDTLLALGELAPASELFWLLGADSLETLSGWHRVEELLALARPVVVARADAEGAPGDLGELSEAARRRLDEGWLALPPVAASSSELRRRLATGQDPGPELPPALREYIDRRGIYRAS